MIRTLKRPVPAVCLQASSFELAKRTQDLLHSVFGFEELNSGTNTSEDDLDREFASPIPGMKKVWRSLGMRCPRSGSIIHLLSLESAWQGSGTIRDTDVLSLLSISDLDEPNDCIAQTRTDLVAHLEKQGFGSCAGLAIRHSAGGTIKVSDLAKDGLPLLKLNEVGSFASEVTGNGLKEICIPYFDGSSYDNGSTLQNRLSSSLLARPVTGLYQFANGLALRPLPSAGEDRVLPSPSFVFHCDDIEEASRRMEIAGARIAKIGFGGTSRRGQFVVVHPHFRGLDVRLDPSKELQTYFAESQESLLAGSLDELQSANVLVEGGKDAKSQVEPPRREALNGLGDCWVEFRANMKRPSGYFRNGRADSKNKLRVAKPPDLPYE